MGDCISKEYESIEEYHPKGWPKDVKYTNVCHGKNYKAIPLTDNKNKIEVREIDEFKKSCFKKPNYGVFAIKKINEGEIICEYTGDFCTTNERDPSSQYLLKFGVGSEGLHVARSEQHEVPTQLYIDAKSYGNSSRFINDQCVTLTFICVALSNTDE